MCGRVRVRMMDRSIHQRTVRGQRGSMHQPLTRGELEDKVQRLAGDDSDVVALGAALEDLIDAPDLTPLLAAVDAAGLSRTPR
jgi:hypothetical protein